MKKILLSLILGTCLVAVTSIPVNAQYYANVTVYTNLRQNVDGVLQLIKLLPLPTQVQWTGYFHFDPAEGGATVGGYIYQKWVLLDNFGGPPTGTLYELKETIAGQFVESHTYAAGAWPTYCPLPGNDFRTTSGQ